MGKNLGHAGGTDWAKMAMRVIHFGWDNCYRLGVLRGMGFEVREANTLDELQAELRDASGYDAVLLSHDPQTEFAQLISMVRGETKAPVVVFRRSRQEIDEKQFDVVVGELVKPADWVRALMLTIERHRNRPQSIMPPGRGSV